MNDKTNGIIRETKKEISWLLNEKYKGIVCDEYLKDVSRVNNGEPIAYVIGFIDFLDCKIDLRYRPLIPRAETEFWCDAFIKTLDVKKKYKCLDMFSGSGCLGLALLKNLPLASVDFCDIDNNCLKQIKYNVKLNGFQERDIHERNIKVLKSDVWNGITDTYDIIVANPPYIPIGSQNVERSVSHYEPKRALYGGADGLDVIQKFVDGLESHTKAGSLIALEFDTGQEKAITALFERLKSFKTRLQKDQYNQYRVIFAERLAEQL